jgi:linoleoyl-CoA desaturase
MYVKAVLILGWFAASYVLLVFVATRWTTALPLSLSLGCAGAGIGFNLMHDGSHGAYSRHAWINRAMALSLELLGGSSYVWKWKHNVVHHTYPNLGGVDDDLEIGPWVRIAPHQPRRKIHRYQQLYMWTLFGLLPFKWYLLDIRNFRRGSVGGQRFPASTSRERAVFIGGKLLLPLWTIAVPLLRHAPLTVALFTFLSLATMGVVLSVTFLLAHCVEDAQCASLPASRRVASEFAVHQIETAVDFAPRNRLLSWYLGGLNFQIEHHLFPQISHSLYPQIAPIVQRACAEFGVRYQVRPTLRAAIAAHYRWLRLMGRPLAIEA